MVLKQPPIFVLIAVRDEEGFIAPCLDSVLAPDYPSDSLETPVMDSQSTDRSPDIVRQYAEWHSCVRLLDNDKRIAFAALNVGPRQARGDFTVRTDAHTTYAPDCVDRCVALVETTGVDNMGGVQKAVRTGCLDGAIAIATTTLHLGVAGEHWSVDTAPIRAVLRTLNQQLPVVLGKMLEHRLSSCVAVLVARPILSAPSLLLSAVQVEAAGYIGVVY